MLFIIFISDLRPGGESNKIVKYADDASMLVPKNTDVQINDEFDKIVAWASENKLGINMAKTKEIVFHLSPLTPKIYYCQQHYPELKGSCPQNYC